MTPASPWGRSKDSVPAWFQVLYGIQPKDDNVHLTVAPLYHTAVMNFTAISLHGGHTIVLIDKWTAEGTLERIEKYRVTHSHMVPTSATISRPTATTA